MSDVENIEQCITYGYRKSPAYADVLVNKVKRSFIIAEKVDEMIQYLKDEIQRSNVQKYQTLCRQELAIYENILKAYTKTLHVKQSQEVTE